MLQKLLIALTGLLCFCAARAVPIIVTSNADSGPGTLREAISLAAANGTATPDIITFNLATDIASRTFSLLSGLPALSSNLIIDASTQQGTAFGVSDAKIILSFTLPAFPPASPTFNCMDAENARDIEIYGIYFRSYSNANGFAGVAIYCNNSTNIKIGAPGKGNLFTGWRTGVGHPEGFNQPFVGSANIFIQSNIFGLMEDGNTTTYGTDPSRLFDAVCMFAISLPGSTNIKIGGSTAAAGNLINFSVCAISLTGPATHIPGEFFIIENNSIGCNVSKTFCTTSAYPNYEPVHAIGLTDLQITGNHIMGINRGTGILVGGCNNFSIKGNAINVDINGNQCNSLMNEGIIIETCIRGIIGGEQPGDKNIIAYTNNLAGIFVPYGSQITISRNSTYCNNNRGSIMTLDNGNTDPALIPFVNIQSATLNSIAGKALPGSVVELFIDDDCALCEGKLYVSSVLADQNGNWAYTGSNTDRMVATATDVNGSTSEFSIAKINVRITPVVKPATCGLQNGAITNMQILSGTAWYWEDEAGNKVGTDTLLRNVGPGKYRLHVEVGSHYCSYKTNYFEITEVLLPASVSPTIAPASCGLNNGSISVNYNNTDQTAKWLSASLDSVGEGNQLQHVLPGNYYLKLLINADTTCNQLYGPFTISNQSGPSLNINNVLVTAATCGNNNGSITGITAVNTTGTPFIQWVDSLNNPVGNNYNLSNMPAGKYRFKYKDASGCDTIITAFYTILNNGVISIDTSQMLVAGSKCAGTGGSIQHIQVTGGETYQWVNTAGNTTVGGMVDLFNSMPGNYVLQVSNHFGCSKPSPVISIPQSIFNAVGVTGFTARDALCGLPNGMIKINSFDKDASLYTFRWTDSGTAQLAGTGTSISNLGAGTYQLLARDSNGCEKMIFASRIGNPPTPSFDYTQLIQKNDHCNLHAGSITSIKVNGLTGPTVYTWHSALNTIAGNTINLQNAASGVYTLQVTDAGVCTIESKPFTITNSNDALALPVYDNLVIPRYADAALRVKNAATGNYTLSATISGAPAIQQNNSGNFTVAKIAADTSFYIKRISGECTSAVAVVNIKVVDKSFFAVPTAFTPNNDRKNDRLAVKVVGYIQLEYFRVFNRFGTLIFETQQVNDGWDGTLKGKLQDTGGYVWIAKGKDINGKVISEKGSFILMR